MTTLPIPSTRHSDGFKEVRVRMYWISMVTVLGFSCFASFFNDARADPGFAGRDLASYYPNLQALSVSVSVFNSLGVRRPMNKKLTLIAMSLFCLGTFAFASSFMPAKSNKEVMKAGFAGDTSLCKKLASGTASDDEKKQFLDLVIDLVENDTSKGDAGEWKMQAGAVALATAKLVVGREGALDAFKAATNCKACHEKFKGK